jgi:hypothetical protein
VRKSFVLAILAILLAGLILFSPNDAAISVADTSTQHNEVTSIMSKAGNSSASATITITMYAVGNE